MKTELLSMVVPQNYIPKDSAKTAKTVEFNSLIESIDADDLSELKKIRIEIKQSLG